MCYHTTKRISLTCQQERRVHLQQALSETLVCAPIEREVARTEVALLAHATFDNDYKLTINPVDMEHKYSLAFGIA